MLPTMRVYGFGFSIFLPCAPPSSAGWSGGVGEDCLSAQREFRSRLASRATQGTAKRRQTGVAFFLVTFSLAKQEKVTCCRATPGGVDFGHSCFDRLSTNGHDCQAGIMAISFNEVLMMIISALRGRLAAVVVFGLLSLPVCAGEVRVAVAANFAGPMERIVPLFEKETGHTVKVSLGSSGKLYSQVKGGAPFDVLLAADEAIPKRLVQEGLAVGGSRFVYALGKLVLWSAQPDFVDAKGAVLNKGGFGKLAIANPRLAPYGVAAKETLEKLTMWNAMQGRLLRGEDIAQAYQFVVTENAELGFIALSQIMSNGKVSSGSSWLVPSEMYKPIRQSAVMLSGAKDQTAAQAFLAFLRSEKAGAVMRGFGYELP